MKVSEVVGQFAYFDAQLDHPDWRGKKVLDIGGNVGNFLLHAGPDVDPHNYWSIDLCRDAIEEGRRRHPEANFVFYDRYNPQYNPTGQPDLPIPALGVRFDIVIGRSVATHLGKDEFLRFVEELTPLTAVGGVIALTYLDPGWVIPEGWTENVGSEMTVLEWGIRRVNPSTDSVKALLARGNAALRGNKLTWATLYDAGDLRLDPEDDALRPPPADASAAQVTGNGAARDENPIYLTLCTSDYMHHLLPAARTRPPVRPAFQHCVVIPVTHS